MLNITLDSRMGKIAECVRIGAILADIGTDHGKLPIYLAQTNKIKKAVACDINEMPLSKAETNIKKYMLESKIDTFLTNGLIGVEKYSPTDVVIAGMGGELIAEILENSTVERTNIKYILQPMTKEEVLRKYLYEKGYSITDEYLVEEGKLYQIICAEYTGVKTIKSDAVYLLGEKNIEKSDKLLNRLIEKVEKRLESKISGMQKAELNYGKFQECLTEIHIIKEKNNVNNQKII